MISSPSPPAREAAAASSESPFGETTPAGQRSTRHQYGRVKTLPPLSPLTYYRRNVWRTLPVGGAIVISVFLIAAIVTLINSVDASIVENFGAARHFSVLAPQMIQDVPPRTVQAVEADPHLGRVIKSVPYAISISTVFGKMPVPVYGVDPPDMPRLAEICGAHLAPGGHWPTPGEPEVVMSRSWANNFHKQVGQKISFQDDRIATLFESQKLVGILDGGENLAMTSTDYLIVALPNPVLRTSYLLVPKSRAELPMLNAHATAVVEGPRHHGLKPGEVRYVKVYTFAKGILELRKSLGFLYTFLAIADILVIGAVALLSGFLANIYFEGRLGEFGLLSAFGFRRERLAVRLVIESGALVVLAWIIGIGMTWVLFRCLDRFYMTPRGLVLAHLDALSLYYTLPTPILVGVASLSTVLLRLYRLDPISIMERR